MVELFPLGDTTFLIILLSVSPLRRFQIDQPSRGICDRSRTGRHTSGMGHKLNHCLGNSVGNSVNYIEYHRKY
jgi:hypothetical protein